MDAIHVIKQDHRTIERLLGEFERLDASPQRERVFRELVRELSIHAAIEEQFLYPALRESGQQGERDGVDALEEHHAMKVTLAELDALPQADERFGAKFRVLARTVRIHLEEEEQEVLPRLEGALEKQQLAELGDTLLKAKRAAPTRPHPAAPDQPPGNLIAGPASALVDRGRDALRDGTEMLRAIAERGAERGGQVAREMLHRARWGGREAMNGVKQRGAETLSEARDRGREMLGEAEQRGKEAVQRIEARGQEAARRVQRQGRAQIRGFEGEPAQVDGEPAMKNGHQRSRAAAGIRGKRSKPARGRRQAARSE